MKLTTKDVVLAQLRSLRLLLLYVSTKCGKFSEDLGHWFFNLVLFHGRIGYLTFEELGERNELADGFIVHLVVDSETGRWVQAKLPFRISNRWPVRNNRKPTAKQLWEIQTTAVTQMDLRVSKIIWGVELWKRQSASPFDMRLAQPDLAHTSGVQLRARIDSWLEQMFGGVTHEESLGQRDAGRIVFKWK